MELRFNSVQFLLNEQNQN